jgi:pyridoxamine 5'-phosphate oxidase family protein
MALTTAEQDYLRSQPLGRLATVGTDGVVQVNPVGFRVRADGSFVVGGRDLARTRKYRNVARTGRAALVVDDLVSSDPWTVRGIEVRGRAEVGTTESPAYPGASADVIVLHPDTVFTWGIEPGASGTTRRDQAS